MDEWSRTSSPSGHTRYPVSRWESARYDAVLGEQHLPARPAEVKVCTQEGRLDEDVAWCMQLKWVSSFGNITPCSTTPQRTAACPDSPQGVGNRQRVCHGHAGRSRGAHLVVP